MALQPIFTLLQNRKTLSRTGHDLGTINYDTMDEGRFRPISPHTTDFLMSFPSFKVSKSQLRHLSLLVGALSLSEGFVQLRPSRFPTIVLNKSCRKRNRVRSDGQDTFHFPKFLFSVRRLSNYQKSACGQPRSFPFPMASHLRRGQEGLLLTVIQRGEVTPLTSSLCCSRNGLGHRHRHRMDN